MLRIGIDFDNTIACYDRSFPEVAGLLGLVTQADASSKSDIKSSLLDRPGGDIDWQRLQGKVYGRYMLRAAVFPGFVEFMCLCRLRGHELFVVSHKTEFGHFDEEQVPLRNEALKWLEVNGLLDESRLGMRRSHIHFESTREDKVSRISEMRCTHFIDDLREVFEEPHFPSDAQKVLFRANPGEPEPPGTVSAASWREISQHILGAASESEISQIANIRFPDIASRGVKLHKGRGNSRIYQLTSNVGVRYALKIYPDRQKDPRPRLETEVEACRLLGSEGYPVVESTASDVNLGWAIYPWVEGAPIEVPDDFFVEEALAFVGRLHVGSRNGEGFARFGEASEACLSGAEIVKQIGRRLGRLESVQSDTLANYLGSELRPVMEAAVARAKDICGAVYFTNLERSLQLPSPSDFGAHNAIRNADGRSVFIDFEYFGWDDPVKLVCDFCWHPGMPLTPAQRRKWTSRAKEIFRNDSSFELRLEAYLPLFGLRWCLILLNEFLSQGEESRTHAAPEKTGNFANLRMAQLAKSKKLLQEIKEMMHDHGSKIEVS